MFYLEFLIFSLGAALLQTAYLRAPKGVVPTKRRILYTVLAAAATGIQVLAGAFRFDPPLIGALLLIPIFYAVNKGCQAISLRLRYTFRIGVAITLLSAYPLIHETAYPLIHDTWKALNL